MQMSAAQAAQLIEEVLLEFPLRMIEIRIPSFLRALPREHRLMQRLLQPVYAALPQLCRVRDYRALAEQLQQVEQFQPARVERVALGEGVATLALHALQPEEGLFYEVLGEECGCDIHDDFELISAMKGFVAAKAEYDRISGALEEARRTGYGVVPPAIDEMELDEPEIVRQGSRFGVRLRARASGLHVIRVDIESEISPIVGTEQQSEALVQSLLATFEQEPGAIWQTNLFGKSLYDLVRDGMAGKGAMQPAVQQRLQTTLQRIVNEGCNGLICIML